MGLCFHGFCETPGPTESCEICAEIGKLKLQVCALSEALVARRAMEPQHSREDHTCKECEIIAEIIHSEMRPTEKRVDEPLKINVNGVTMELAAGGNRLTYANILKLADERPGASVVFKGAVGPRAEGSLIQGQSILVTNGTIINCIQTGNA